MPRKSEPSLRLKQIIWDLAAATGTENLAALQKDLDYALEKLRKDEKGNFSEDTPDVRTIRRIIKVDIQSLEPEVVVTKLPRHVWHLRSDYEAIKQLAESNEAGQKATREAQRKYCEESPGQGQGHADKQRVVPGLQPGNKIVPQVKAETTTPESHWKDAPWNIGTLEAHPLPEEAIPFVLKVLGSGGHIGKFTIRQSIWVARLYRQIPDIALLDYISWHYSLREKISELSGMPFNCAMYDSLLNSPIELIKTFKSEHLETRAPFETSRAAAEALMGYTLDEVTYEIYFKGNECWARFKPDVLIGQRDDVIEVLKKSRYWNKSTPIPEGDFSFRLPSPLLWHVKSRNVGESTNLSEQP